MKDKKHQILFDPKEVKSLKLIEQDMNIDADWFRECNTEISYINHVHTRFALRYTSSCIVVNGTITFNIRYICSRCGEEFIQDMTDEISEEYEGDSEIDLLPLFKEIVILNYPIKILCPKCKRS